MVSIRDRLAAHDVGIDTYSRVQIDEVAIGARVQNDVDAIETRVSDLEVRTQNLDLQETTPKAATTPSYIHVYTRKKRSVVRPLHVNIQGIYGHLFLRYSVSVLDPLDIDISPS